MTNPLEPVGSLLAEQLTGLSAKIDTLTAARVTYVGGTVTALDHVNSTFAADILQPDSTTINVAGIRSSPQFLPAIGNIVTLGLSGPQIIYLPYGVAAASIDTPQLSPTVTGSITAATTAANAAIYSGQNLVPDPSFENGFITTYTSPFTLDVSGSNAHTGGKAVQALPSVGAQNMIVTPAAIPILQSHTYRLSGWRKTDASYNGTSSNGKLKIVKQDGATAVASAVWTSGTSYAQVQTTYTVPSDGSVSSLQVVIGTDHTAGNLWVDDLELVDITDANAAVVAASSKIITFIQNSAPTASETGDLWMDSSNGNKLFRWSGAAWVAVQDQAISTALTNAATAQGTANSKIITFIQSTAPTASETGDMWMDSSNGNKLFRWSGAAWVSVQDTAITSAITAAAAAQATADTKVLVFAQGTTPTAQEVGDIWFNTADGMKMFIWGPTATVTRVNQSNNPSFEYDAAGVRTSITGWSNYSSGSNGTVTRTIVTTGGVTNGTKAAKSSASSQAATAGVGHGVQQGIVAAPGDIIRAQATAQLATTGSNFVPHLQIEFLNGSGTVLSGTTTASGSGTLTTNQLLSLTSGAAPSSTASTRVTFQRRTAATTGSALATSDITWDSVLIEKNRDSAAPTTYFDGTTLASTNDSKWDNPSAQPNSTSTEWTPGVSGVNGWQLQQFRTGAMEPQSILGNNCIAYGSITAPLLEAVLVLAGTIVAGNPNADHAALMTDGLHLFRTITGEGVQEVGTMAVGAFGTLMSWVDSTGQQVALVDEGGAASFTDLNVDGDPVFQGQTLTALLNQRAVGAVASSYNNALSITGITTRIGLAEVSLIQDSSRSYAVNLHMPHLYTNTGPTRALFSLRSTTDGSSPTTTSPMFDSCFFVMANGSSYVYSPPDIFSYGNWASGNGAKIRVLACIESFDGGNVNVTTGTDPYQRPFRLVISDAGLNIPDTYLANSGGGGVTSKTTYDTGDISPSSFGAWNGAGTLRSDTTDVVQGTDPSGFNGDGKGGWNFTIPNISGTVNWVQLYVYNNWAYNNSGGHALIRPVTSSNSGSPTQLQSVYDPGVLYPKPGPVRVTLPSSWNSTFTGKTSIGLYLGPSSLVGGAGNELYYIRADGPSARLRINYTQ